MKKQFKLGSLALAGFAALGMVGLSSSMAEPLVMIGANPPGGSPNPNYPFWYVYSPTEGFQAAPGGGTVPVHGGGAFYPEESAGAKTQHTPGMKGMVPWTGAKMFYSDGGWSGLHPQPKPVISQPLTDSNRLKAQKALLGIDGNLDNLWQNYISNILTHNEMIREIVKLSATDFDGPADHGNLHRELMQTMLNHGEALNSAYEKLLGQLSSNKQAILKRSYEQVLFQHRQMQAFLQGTQ